MKKLNLHFQKYSMKKLLCNCILVITLAYGFYFPNSLPRLAESFRDFGTSVAYYFQQLFDLNFTVRPTVIDKPSWQFAPSRWEIVTFFPYTWEEFAAMWESYWQVLVSKENLIAYGECVGDVLFYVSRGSVFVLPVFIIVSVTLNRLKTKHVTKRGKKSKPLIQGEKFAFKCIYPVIASVKDYVEYVKTRETWWKALLVLWMLYFNVFSIVIEAIAFYFFFCASWEPLRIYDQLLKLQIDLSPVIRFIPGIIWLCIGVWVYNYICRSMAFNRLYYYERCNRAFLRERGVTSVVYGSMGVGKTQFITSMALSAEIEQYDNAFQIMLDKDMMFPNFPWQRLRDELKRRIDNRDIVDIPSCRAFVRRCSKFFDRISTARTFEEWQRKRKNKRYKKLFDHTFGYDYTHYSTTHNDELKITRLFEAIEDYACAYLIFTVKTTLLFANYSIRVDSIIQDIGNMPLRDNDFFVRSPERQEAYSRHAHIIDYDMLRLGKKMVKDNPKARRLSFGVYVITEIDKERKNMNELKETKIKADETNQRNDLFNACLMMSRHAAVVDNKVFIRFIMDLQRPEAWGAGGRELGEVIYIAEKDELNPLLPTLSPYWIFHTLFEWVKEKWEEFYAEYIHNRADNTLLVHCTKNIIAKINNHYEKVNGQFGAQILKLEIQAGTLEGEPKRDTWRLLMKKDRSKRYQTACLESVFDSYTPNTMHVDDFISYAAAVGTSEENQLQNSYFQDDISKMRDK